MKKIIVFEGPKGIAGVEERIISALKVDPIIRNNFIGPLKASQYSWLGLKDVKKEPCGSLEREKKFFNIRRYMLMMAILEKAKLGKHIFLHRSHYSALLYDTKFKLMLNGFSHDIESLIKGEDLLFLYLDIPASWSSSLRREYHRVKEAYYKEIKAQPKQWKVYSVKDKSFPFGLYNDLRKILT